MVDPIFDYQFRLILIGDSVVGKSSLLKFFTDGKFAEVGTFNVAVARDLKTQFKAYYSLHLPGLALSLVSSHVIPPPSMRNNITGPHRSKAQCYED